jgi:hypothetical protein
MIKMSASMNTESFQKSLRSLADLKKDVPKLVKRVAANVVKDCMKLTPPFGGAPSSETWGTQKKSGERAVENDLRQIFVKLGDLDAVKMHKTNGVGAALKLYASKGDANAVVKILHNIKINAAGFSIEPRQGDHLAKRTKYGRARKSGGTYFVDGGLEAYIKTTQKRVGKAKHGWMAAAAALGIKGIPRWIAGQQGPSGDVTITGVGTARFSVVFENTVPYIQSKGADLKIVREAFKSTQVRLDKEVQKILDYRMKKAKAA